MNIKYVIFTYAESDVPLGPVTISTLAPVRGNMHTIHPRLCSTPHFYALATLRLGCASLTGLHECPLLEQQVHTVLFHFLWRNKTHIRKRIMNRPTYE